MIALAAVALVAVIALVYIALRSQLAPGPSLVGRTVVVHTRRPDDQSVRGILVAQHADRLTLREPVYLHSSGQEAAPGGLVHVPLLSISTMQELEPAREPE